MLFSGRCPANGRCLISIRVCLKMRCSKIHLFVMVYYCIISSVHSVLYLIVNLGYTLFSDKLMLICWRKTWNNMKHLENLPVQISVLCLPVFSHEKGSKGRGVFSCLAHFFTWNPCHAMRLMVLAMGQMRSACFFHGHAHLACSQTCAATRWATWVNKELKWPIYPCGLSICSGLEQVSGLFLMEIVKLVYWNLEQIERMCLICYWKASRV